MSRNSNGPRESLTPGVRESNAAAALPKVAHASDIAQQGLHSVETDETAVVRDYWQTAKRLYQHGDYPDYASDDWCALPIEDPRKLAGLVAHAENWRKYHLDIADELNDALKPHPPIWQRPTLAELNQAHDDMLARNRRSTRKEAA